MDQPKVRHSSWLNTRLAASVTGALVALWSAAGWIFPRLHLSENQTLYIFSSESQVIAAVYGLILAGYVFLRNQQERLAERDESLVEILDGIQSRQYRFVAFITILSSASMVASLLAIACHDFPQAWVRVVMLNSAAALFFSSLVWTGLFVLDAMQPGAISRASEAIKSDVEKVTSSADDTTDGGLVEFLANFNAIADDLDKYALDRLKSPSEITNRVAIDTYSLRDSRPSWTPARTVRALASQKTVPKDLIVELQALIRYRNALVHGQDLHVSPGMIARIKAAHQRLLQALSMLPTYEAQAGNRPGEHP